MAEILVMARDNVMTDRNGDPVDPAIDAQQSFKKGFPVLVMEDGHAWCAEESLPRFVILKIPGVSVTAVNQYLQPWVDTDGQTILRPKLWQIAVDSLPAGVRQTLATTGQYTTTWNAIRTYIKNLRDGSTAS